MLLASTTAYSKKVMGMFSISLNVSTFFVPVKNLIDCQLKSILSMSFPYITCVIHTMQCMLKIRWKYSGGKTECERSKIFIPLNT